MACISSREVCSLGFQRLCKNRCPCRSNFTGWLLFVAVSAQAGRQRQLASLAGSSVRACGNNQKQSFACASSSKYPYGTHNPDFGSGTDRPRPVP